MRVDLAPAPPASAASRRLDGGDVDLLHRHHRLEGALGLYEGQNGWRLSPAYDLNPVPIDIKPRVLVTAITEDHNTASLALAFEVAGYFEISTTRAPEIAAEVAAVVSTWRAQAKRRGISRREIDRMASAFEHRDLEIARGR